MKGCKYVWAGALALALAGCGASGGVSEATLAGTWKVAAKAPEAAPGRSAAPAMGALMLQFKPDKTFALGMGMPAAQMGGTWSLDAGSRTVAMTFSKAAAGQRAMKAMALSGELDPSGSRLTLRNQSAGASSSFHGLVFEKPA